MFEEIFKLAVADFKKLEKFGFKKEKVYYVLRTPILDGQFSLDVYIDEKSKVKTRVFDNLSQEEYVLYLVGGVGEFVGRVKSEVEKVLTNIKNECFVNNLHFSKQTDAVIDYVREKFGDELEYLWEKFPTNAIWRRKDNRKWYGIIMAISKRKLGLDDDELVEVMDVRIDPSEIDSVVDGKTLFYGYHLNKRRWLTFCLDGSVDFALIKAFIDKSYELANLKTQNSHRNKEKNHKNNQNSVFN